MGSVSDRKPAQAATVGPAITAGTTQTQAGATVLVKDINEVTVSGTNGDGVQLPPASKGLRVTIINADAAQTIQVWPASGDDIDGGATNAVDSSAIASGDTRDYEAINSSSWYGVGAAGTGDALTSNPLSQFASTTSAQLAGVISNETGSGALAFATSPTLVTPVLGTPSSGTATNLTGLPAAGVVGTAAILGVNTFTGSQIGTVTALTSSSASIAINLGATNNFSHTLAENTTLAAPSNPVAGQSGVINLTQDASTPRTLAYNTFWEFAGGTVPALTATTSAVDTFVYYVHSASKATCQLIGDVK